jgi:RHS repeat-associated protein
MQAGAGSNYPFLTLKERDNETGLDYFLARYYSSTHGRFTSVDPSRKSVALTDPQSWNRYTYALNKPLTLVDENGKWPTKIHDLIVDRSLPGLSAAQRKEIKNGSWSVDDPLKGGQNTSRSNEHGMTIPGQSQGQAAENADTFINTNVDNAKYNYGHHGLTSSLYDFGRAFHTVSDMTSPAHEGYQVWYLSETRSHMNRESSIDNFRMGLAVGATLSLYRYTYSQAELQRATGYTPGSENDPSVSAIRSQYSLPGSNPSGEAEALYEYRRGLQEGLNFDWGMQRGRRGPR